MTKVVEDVIQEMERVVETKNKHGICFVGKDIKGIQRVIDYLVNELQESVYDLSYHKDGHYSSEYTLSEFRYMRLRPTSKYGYTSREAREDLKFWTQPVDLGHIMFLVVPKEPIEYFEFTEKEVEEFDKKFYCVRVGEVTQKSD